MLSDGAISASIRLVSPIPISLSIESFDVSRLVLRCSVWHLPLTHSVTMQTGFLTMVVASLDLITFLTDVRDAPRCNEP